MVGESHGRILWDWTRQGQTSCWGRASHLKKKFKVKFKLSCHIISVFYSNTFKFRSNFHCFCLSISIISIWIKHYICMGKSKKKSQILIFINSNPKTCSKPTKYQ